MEKAIDVLFFSKPRPTVQEIKELFEPCGKVAGIYPWRSNSTDKHHCFVEFWDSASVAEACSRFKNRNNLLLIPLGPDPVLKGRFIMLSSRGSSRRDRPETTRSSLPTSSPKTEHPSHPLSTSKSHDQSLDAEPQQSEVKPSQTLSQIMKTEATQVLDQQLATSPPSVPPKQNPETVIKMTVRGDRLDFDLDKQLDADHDNMIWLLEQGDSFGNWMTVAAHYRRIGSISAATAVVKAFIPWALKQNPKTNLKPAQLFLSSLNTQIPTEPRTRDPRTTGSEMVSKDSMSANTVASASSGDVVSSGKNSSKPVLDHVEHEYKSSRDSRKYRSTDYSRSNKENSQPKSSSSRPLEESSASGRHRSRSRTPLQSQSRFNYRHSHRERSPDYKDLDRAKRKAEYQLESERSRRHKLEDTYSETRKELEKTKQLADLLQSQVRSEVERRRVVERDLADLAREREERESWLRGQIKESIHSAVDNL
ncbi:hypothetical protein SISSUDRAFT_1057494 [Sistotremastrum suecicum HHB10207 ss-3]|uniref:RRM domain-containing protein n=1 Tax=Sistotremastrum suecicum HHB10207 ss-3 TaxID=1314776 RepID=A0A166I7L5_9AGAM|nr:hypothetical protein SISSUDRAFT_1057494 [Sistotremastrum suecicum HHB10207 ss-3]